MSPNDHVTYIDPYPNDDNEYMEIENAIFASPRFNLSAWSDYANDYAFIKINNPTRPNHFVRPVRFSICPRSLYSGP